MPKIPSSNFVSKLLDGLVSSQIYKEKQSIIVLVEFWKTTSAKVEHYNLLKPRENQSKSTSHFVLQKSHKYLGQTFE